MIFIICLVIVIVVFVVVSSLKQRQTVLTYVQDTVSDYDILKQYLTYNIGLIPEKTNKKTADFIVMSYIEYFCKIHCQHIQNTYPPARMVAAFLGNNVLGVNMVVTKVLEDFKKVGVHSTLGDLYKDAFVVLGHFGNTNHAMPELRPWQSNKYILDELCDEDMVSRYAQVMEKSISNRKRG